MATQITTSGDILNMSYAVNDDATIRWCVYDRLIAGARAVYVQRDTGGGFPGQGGEVQILAEGSLPKIIFDSTSAQWIILYTLIENVFYVTFGENEVPTIQPPQTGDTATDHLRQVGITDDGDIGGVRTMADRIKGYGPFGLKVVDFYSGPARPIAVGVAASTTPGKIAIRWRPEFNQWPDIGPGQEPVAGYEVFKRTPGGFVQVGGLFPHTGLGDLHEAEVDAAEGEYYVRQVNFAGTSSTTQIRGRFVGPKDTLLGDGLSELRGVVASILLGTGLGEGQPPALIRVVNTAPVVLVVPPDSFLLPALGGSGEAPEFAILKDNEELVPPIIENDSFLIPVLGRGRRLRFAQTGFPPVIIT